MPQVAKVIAISPRKTCRTRRCFWTKSNMKGRDFTSRARLLARQVEDQQLGAAPCFDGDAAIGLKRIARLQRMAVHRDGPIRDMHIAHAIPAEREFGALV